MRGRTILAIALMTAAGAVASTSASAQPAPWVPLGCQSVGFNVDRDVLRVDRRGFYTAIRLRVSGNDVRFFDLKVVYGNGDHDDIPVRAVVRAGGQSGTLDLKGGVRSVVRIEMVYEARRNFAGRARVCAEGLSGKTQPGAVAPPMAPVPPPAAAWVVLGCQPVGFNVDRDVLRVGRRDGRFTAIRLRVAGNDIRMLDLKVVYGNGEHDDIPVRAVIRAGGQSGLLDLHGRNRIIERVEMVYESRRNFRGRAEVCVDGRPG
jgi:hypothetical protein